MAPPGAQIFVRRLDGTGDAQPVDAIPDSRGDAAIPVEPGRYEIT
jgi:hypothetical protein